MTEPTTSHRPKPSRRWWPLRPPHRHSTNPKPRWLSGWRTSVLTSTLLITASLTLNAVVANWLTTHATFTAGLAELYRGDCAHVQSLDTYVHLAVNVLSTLMLSGSNYTMQVLVGPSREEVDVAHARGRWLDIGVPSVRNLGWVAKWRVGVWWVLALSSLPLHLMFNSAFYSAISTHDYNILITTESFLDGADFTLPTIDNDGNDDSPVVSLTDAQKLQRDARTFDNLTNADCIAAYANDIISERRNLVIVSSNISDNAILFHKSYAFNASINLGMDLYDPYPWICSDPATAAYMRSNPRGTLNGGSGCYRYVSFTKQYADGWAPENYKAEYCMSEKVPRQCSFNANLPIVITVIVCNAIKVVSMLYVLFALKTSPLLVVGDAIASFLTVPDETTKDMCLLSRHEVIFWHTRVKGEPSYGPFRASSERKRWWSAPSPMRWRLTIALMVACGLVVMILFGLAMKNLQGTSVADMGALGFGEVHAQTLIRGAYWPPSNIASPSGQVITSILIANAPQLILSLVYFNLNGLLTAMFAADEWSRFAVSRRTLRVSHPRRPQRGTYFLNLPYRAALPLMGLSTLLHWLVSRSIFLAVISERGPDGRLISANQIATCGFSPFPMLAVFLLTLLMLLALGVLGTFRRFHAFIPVVASCSAAIAAACHVPAWERDGCRDGDKAVDAHDLALKPLQWGVVTPPGLKADDPVNRDFVGHCCFSSTDVFLPEHGRVYAGMPPPCWRNW